MTLLQFIDSPFLTNVITVTTPLVILLWRIERRLTILETEHRLRTTETTKCQPNLDHHHP